MSAKTNFIHFDATTVPLQGSNLIEASAGTGKTYSIAILVLRLVLEERLSVKEILMVTFTKAAVAELEERIRLFIRCAYKVSLGEAIQDDTITGLVKTAMGEDEEKREEVQNRMKAAVLLLDETSVLTIHSFCQQVLTEFAFETGQVFGAETLQDSSILLADEVNKFLRKEITTLQVDLLNNLLNAGLSRQSISDVVKQYLDGKKFSDYDEQTSYAFCQDDQNNWLAEVNELKEKEIHLRKCLESHVDEHREAIVNSGKGNKYAAENVLPKIDRPNVFLAFLWEKKTLANIKKLYGELLEKIQNCEDVAEERNAALRKVITRLYCAAIQQVTAGVQKHKQHNNLLTFDDMIVNLHSAFYSANSTRLIEGLRHKYKAVFVDEFQDTDRLQYDIFHHAFCTGTILFYIGDPKQSIYAWRKADIFTYFKAKGAVERVYGMNHNYRSSAPYIDAMNVFFSIEDPFYFKGADNAIEYITVDTPAHNKKGQLLKNGNRDVPITVSSLKNKPSIVDAVAAQVVTLLDDQAYCIEIGGEREAISPADIGILVRSNAEGQLIKARLSKLGIPAVTISDAKVLHSMEAAYVWYLLLAIDEPTRGNINRALLSPFTGFDVEQLLVLNEEVTIDLFKQYKKTWEEDGIYTALMNFVADYRVRQVLLQGKTESGERIITNLFQLIELVHKVQTYKNLSPLELIGWLKRGIDGMLTEGDEYEQRVESDEDAIKIVTIHKSKGLEYNIVLAPFLDFTSDRTNFSICSFRHPISGEYIAMESHALTKEQKEWYQEQNEQENRRLLYVAITRAVYKCFIYRNEYYRNSSLVPFVQSQGLTKPSLIEAIGPLTIAERYHYSEGGVQASLASALIAKSFTLLHNQWRKMSYSSLSAKSEKSSKNNTGVHEEDYDRFVFSELAKGAHTGNMLHYIFENIDFSKEDKWDKVIDDAITRFAPKKREEYTTMLKQMLQHVIYAPIDTGDDMVYLHKVAFHKRIHEFEFDFPVPRFNPRGLNKISNEEVKIAVKYFPELEGMMNGKMDLFFEYNDKYYILDWKSNFLGGALVDYSKEKLMNVMNENNYHLQYLIYTLAAKKFLESRLGNAFDYERDFGGVIYLFVRGVRNETDHGVFTSKPLMERVLDLEKIFNSKSVLQVEGIPVANIKGVEVSK